MAVSAAFPREVTFATVESHNVHQKRNLMDYDIDSFAQMSRTENMK
ncbi:MAG TPA: hypothetical protein VFI43_00550 [Nitrosospira sp.]|nr:hypothetical protein [Nitrosospira sp.]